MGNRYAPQPKRGLRANVGPLASSRDNTGNGAYMFPGYPPYNHFSDFTVDQLLDPEPSPLPFARTPGASFNSYPSPPTNTADLHFSAPPIFHPDGRPEAALSDVWQ